MSRSPFTVTTWYSEPTSTEFSRCGSLCKCRAARTFLVQSRWRIGQRKNREQKWDSWEVICRIRVCSFIAVREGQYEFCSQRTISASPLCAASSPASSPTLSSTPCSLTTKPTTAPTMTHGRTKGCLLFHGKFCTLQVYHFGTRWSFYIRRALKRRLLLMRRLLPKRRQLLHPYDSPALVLSMRIQWLLFPAIVCFCSLSFCAFHFSASCFALCLFGFVTRFMLCRKQSCSL
jgi:hypothetical protein